MKKPIILFFIGDGMPTDEERAEAESYGFKVAFRNKMFVDEDAFPEECDAVAGDVPANYAHLPSPDEVITAYQAHLDQIKMAYGDEEAPAPQAPNVGNADGMVKPSVNPAIDTAKKTPAGPKKPATANKAWGAGK